MHSRKVLTDMYKYLSYSSEGLLEMYKYSSHSSEELLVVSCFTAEMTFGSLKPFYIHPVLCAIHLVNTNLMLRLLYNILKIKLTRIIKYFLCVLRWDNKIIRLVTLFTISFYASSCRCCCVAGFDLGNIIQDHKLINYYHRRIACGPTNSTK